MSEQPNQSSGRHAAGPVALVLADEPDEVVLPDGVAGLSQAAMPVAKSATATRAPRMGRA